MLESISIKDYAIIENIDIEFNEGFNIITGETGSGKSIIIGAIELLMGGRADSSLVRKGKEKCVITAQFSTNNIFVAKILSDNDIEIEENLILTRIIANSGKSKAMINDRVVSASLLKSLKPYLIDIAGQFEAQGLLNENYQLTLFDSLGKYGKILSGVKVKYEIFNQAQLSLDRIKREIAEAKKRKEFVKFQIDEIEKLDILSFDINKAEQELLELKNHQKTLNISKNIVESISNEGGVVSALDNIEQQLYKFEGSENKYEKIFELISELSGELKELEYDLSDKISMNPQEVVDNMDLLQEKIVNFKGILHKYSLKEDEIVSYYEELKKSLDLSESGVLEEQKLTEYRDETLQDYKTEAKILSDKREELSQNLMPYFAKGMEELAIKGGELIFKVTTNENFPTENGSDTIDIIVKTNIGEDFKPLKEIASGGEISRILLLIKELYSKNSGVPTVVFDEIDTGIGGETASKIATHIKNISAKTQVFAITHLHQIASVGDSHYLVKKYDDGEKTYSSIKCLQGEEKVVDIARMIGDSKDKTVLETARKLLKEN